MTIKQQHIQTHDACYHNFVIHIRTERTKYSYMYALDKFKRYCQVENYSDLLFGEDIKRIQSIISDFLVHSQAAEGMSSSTISQYKSTLKFFYDMNDVTSINWTKIGRLIKEYRKVANDRPYTI